MMKSGRSVNAVVLKILVTIKLSTKGNIIKFILFIKYLIIFFKRKKMSQIFRQKNHKRRSHS